MLTVGRTVAVVADGLRSIYGEEARSIASFALRLCRERHDAQGERVWIRVLDRIAMKEGPARPAGS
ncbi:MAG: hypothetical protein U1E62_20275 [Alsobacter sp.]